MTEHENIVINATREGLASAGVVVNEETEDLFRMIYRAGYNQGKIDAQKDK